jgi:hypothetical protein
MVDPNEILEKVNKILHNEGNLLVNSYLLDETTKDYENWKIFYTEEEMRDLLKKHGFDIIEKDGHLLMCKKRAP